MFAQFARFLTVVLICWSAYAQETQAPVSQAPSIPTTTDSVPHLIRFSGTVKDVSGKPVSGVVGITFALYADENGGPALWLETQNVQADALGHYTASLGVTQPLGIPADIFTSGEARWLGAQPDGQAEQPRVLLLSVPYALKAADAATIGGLPPSAFVRANPEGGPFNESNESSVAATSDASKSGPSPLENKTVTTPGGTTDFLPRWTSGNVLGDSRLFQSSSGQIGLNTTTPGASLEIDSPNQLGLFLHAPVSGVGAGLDFFTTGSGGKQWELLATGKTSVQGAGKLNLRDVTDGGNDVLTIVPGGFIGIENTSPTSGLDVRWNNSFGTAIFAEDEGGNGTGAVTGVNTATLAGAAGVVGAATSANDEIESYGVFGSNVATSQFAAAVYGQSAATSGPTRGTVGEADSPTGTGVWGFASSLSKTGEIIGCCAVGVWGDTGSSAPGAAGLVGTSDGGQALVAFNNSTTTTANITNFVDNKNAVILSVNAGAFNNPAVFCNFNTSGESFCSGPQSVVVSVDNSQRHVALHAVESPENWFEDFGSGQLESGTGRIALEPTFAQTVNTGSEYHVFLTPEGECRGLYVSNKLATGFEVHELGGGQSNVGFSYRIVALRRGYENKRLEDETAMVAKTRDNMPKPPAEPAERWTPPVRPKLFQAPAPANQAVAVPTKPVVVSSAY